MTDRPLHIYDLIAHGANGATPRQHPKLGDHWYWCRRHERPEYCDWAMVGCTRVGPFMSEAEAYGAGRGLLRVEADARLSKPAPDRENEQDVHS